MNTSDQHDRSPVFEKSVGSFEIEVTLEVLRQACDSACTIQDVQMLRKLHARLQSILKRRENALSRGMISLVVFLNITSLTVSIVFFVQGETNGGYFWGGLFLLIFVALLTIVFGKHYRRLLVSLHNRAYRAASRTANLSAQRTFEDYKVQTPYTIEYQIEENSWRSMSAPGGEKRVDLEPPMVVLHDDSTYIVYESERSTKWLFSLRTDTAEQRSLIEANLALNRISCHHIDEFDLDLEEFTQ